MPKFKNLSHLQSWVEKNLIDSLYRSGDLERVLAEALVDSIWKNVYDAYDPQYYSRREDEGGLADSRNFAITSINLEDGKVRIIYENLTQGNDNLKSEFLTDTIEEGIKNNWNKEGVWSNPRPYMREAVDYLERNPERLIGAVKEGLRSKGMVVR